MKVSDNEMMQAIFIATLREMPYRTIEKSLGDRYALQPDKPLNLRRSVMQLATMRHRLNIDLSVGHSLKRIRSLVETDALHSDEGASHPRANGQTFYFWLPMERMRIVWLRCRQLLYICGIDEKPKTILASIESLASSVSDQLLEEFALHQTWLNGHHAWVAQSVPKSVRDVHGLGAKHLYAPYRGLGLPVRHSGIHRRP
ncbi:hypothetical protein [Nissabacter sp. SGAir0207]|uniref:hypothetical protein n=1 Tax=Nissabacter sp. SGAir0207 TaxID=2126321 RepID=UPI0010CCFCD9|nr:hypothetical protein [Nissabacter sp. SGAir0207]QCR38761.1 hypothetical protein C1N62_21780 [Nissabacter sp. SGAir0207]